MESGRFVPSGSTPVVEYADKSPTRRRVQIWLLGLSFWAAFCILPIAFPVPCEVEWQGTPWHDAGTDEIIGDALSYAGLFFVARLAPDAFINGRVGFDDRVFLCKYGFESCKAEG